MWETQCHKPPLGMVSIPPIYGDLGDGLWHWLYHIKYDTHDIPKVNMFSFILVFQKYFPYLPPFLGYFPIFHGFTTWTKVMELGPQIQSSSGWPWRLVTTETFWLFWLADPPWRDRNLHMNITIWLWHSQFAMENPPCY